MFYIYHAIYDIYAQIADISKRSRRFIRAKPEMILSMWPGTHVTNALWANKRNLATFLLNLVLFLSMNSGHDFANTTTA